MHRYIVMLFAGALATGVFAEDGAVRLTKLELASFLPGAQVTHVSKSGSLRRWTNEPDGKLVASTDNKKYGGQMGTKGASGVGSWAVNDEGKYCVTIDWKRELENWCAYVLKTSEGLYYLNSVDPSRKIEFAR